MRVLTTVGRALLQMNSHYSPLVQGRSGISVECRIDFCWKAFNVLGLGYGFSSSSCFLRLQAGFLVALTGPGPAIK